MVDAANRRSPAMTTFAEIRALDAEHGMQTYGRLPVAFVRGEGTKLWDSEGSEYLDFLGGLAVTVAGARAPGGRRRDRRAGAHAAARVEPLLQRRGSRRLAARLDALLRWRRPGVLRQLGRRGQRVRDQAGAPVRPGQRRPRSASTCSRRGARSTAARSPRSPRPASPRSRRRSSRCPPGSGTSAFADLDALAAAMDERVCAVMLEPIQGEGGVQPSPPGYLEGVRRSATSGRPCSWSTRCRPGSGRTGRWFGFEHAAACGPTSSPWPRPSATACPSARAGPAPTVATAFRPGDHAIDVRRPAARGARRARRCSTSWNRSTRRHARRAAGAPARARRCSTCPASPTVRGVGLLLAAELDPGMEAGPVAAACLEAGLVVNAVTPTALRFAPPLLVTDDEIDAAVAILAAGAGRGRCPREHAPELPRGRRPRPGGVRRMLDAAGRWKADPSLGPAPARRAGRGAAVREAVGADPRRRPRWPSWASAAIPSTCGPRRSASTSREIGGGRRPHLRRVLRGDRGPGVRPRHARARWRRVVDVPIVNLLSDRAHPVPGAWPTS